MSASDQKKNDSFSDNFLLFFSFSDVLGLHDLQKWTLLLCYGLSRPSGLPGNVIAEISGQVAAAVSVIELHRPGLKSHRRTCRKSSNMIT